MGSQIVLYIGYDITLFSIKQRGIYAIQQAIAKSAKSLRNLDWFEVVETRGHIVNAKVAHFQVKIKIGFRLD